MWTPEERARVERLEALLSLVLYNNLIFATASGTITAAGVVTINHQTANIASIVANVPGNTLTVNFAAPFDQDGIYFVVGFVYDPINATSPFLPFSQTTLQTVLLGTYPPPPGPWNFALFAVSNS